MENKLLKTTTSKLDLQIESIPIVIDSVKNYKDFNMSRCNYFTIESVEPQADWEIILQNSNIPLYLLHLQGILYCSLEKSFFSNVEKITNLFNTIEQEYNLSVDVNDIWIPNFLFHPVDLSSFTSKIPKRRDVYRISQGLFNEAFRFRENLISQTRYEKICEIFKGTVNYLAEETYAFLKYEEKLISEMIRIYPKESKYELKWESRKEAS